MSSTTDLTKTNRGKQLNWKLPIPNEVRLSIHPNNESKLKILPISFNKGILWYLSTLSSFEVTAFNLPHAEKAIATDNPRL